MDFPLAFRMGRAPCPISPPYCFRIAKLHNFSHITAILTVKFYENCNTVDFQPIQPYKTIPEIQKKPKMALQPKPENHFRQNNKQLFCIGNCIFIAENRKKIFSARFFLPETDSAATYFASHIRPVTPYHGAGNSLLSSFYLLFISTLSLILRKGDKKKINWR